VDNFHAVELSTGAQKIGTVDKVFKQLNSLNIYVKAYKVVNFIQ